MVKYFCNKCGRQLTSGIWVFNSEPSRHYCYKHYHELAVEYYQRTGKPKP